jgi:hypothetical protein
MKKVALFLPAIPLICGLFSTIVFYTQGGFGGGHGDFDFLIGILGLPSILLMETVPLPALVLKNDILLVVWLPAILNALLFSLASGAILTFSDRIRRRRAG